MLAHLATAAGELASFLSPFLAAALLWKLFDVFMEEGR